MLEIKKLSVSYKAKKENLKAIGNINLKINKGDICAIIGPSGCGKSTFLNVLAGIIKEYEGEVLINDEVLNPYKHKISFIPQNFGLLPWKTVKENLLLPFKIKKIKIDKAVINRIDTLMRRLNISELGGRYPRELSGGQCQRVSIIKGFIMEPDLLLMDEPFSALDAIIREEAQELFLEIWNENKSTTLFVTHSIDEALYMGSKIIIMSNTPGIIIDVIDNPLFNNSNLKEHKEYLKIFNYIKDNVRRGWGK